MTPALQLTGETTPAEIAALDARVFGAAADSEESWAAELSNGSGKILIARLSAVAVGFVSFFRSAEDIEVRKIGVVPQSRRRGVAEGLLNAALETMPAKRCIIDVSAANAGAIGFYKKFGFRELARRRNYYSDGSDAIVMEHIK